MSGRLHGVLGHACARAILLCAAIASAGSASPLVRGEDISAPAILQDFENSYTTIENRVPDVFDAGYGAVYTPPPGRADSGNQSVGYDQYNRFDLGSEGNPTLYGTETGLKSMISAVHTMGGNAYIDLVWNHSGFSDLNTLGFAASGGYPGLAITLQSTNPSAPGYNKQGINAPDGDYHPASDTGDLNGRLSGLVDIAQESNNSLIRNPVNASDPRNIPAGTTPAYGRLANVPDPANARFYPDTSLQPIIVYDPTTGEQNIKIYPFNTKNPMNGTPVPENALGYLMRNAQWLVQDIGADGFRVDAAKNMPSWVLNYLDRAVYRESDRTLLNGQQQQIFSFSEVYDSNPATLQQYVRKDINPATPGVIGGNRDVLDFPLFFAMQSNLTGNGLQNDWNNVVNASVDVHDDGLHNGSQGVSFVSSQDNGPPALSSVAYAYTLMMPGNALVYFNGHEFGNNRSFPQDGREDALGGAYGNAITTLVDLRNRYGRGNYRQDFLEKESFAYERQGSSLVMLSNRTDAGFDSRTIDVTFAPGMPLIELTGNAHSPTSDPNGNIPQLLIVNADPSSPTGASVNARFLRNSTLNSSGNSVFTGNGYLVYGLPTPQGNLTLTNIAQVMKGATPSASDPNISYLNGTTRLANVDVIKANSFQVQLATNAVNLLGTYRDHPADGDNAIVKMDGGLDLNGNGYVDYTDPNSVAYGFEEFKTAHNPGYYSSNGNGYYAQSIDTSKLSDGYHYIEVRAFRYRNDNGPAVYSDWKQTIYVDRNPPLSAVASFGPLNGNDNNRQLVIQSVDQTANSIHTFLNLPAALTDQQILAMVNGSNQAGQIDRDLFAYGYNNVLNGNNVITAVSYRPTGSYSIMRFPGQHPSTTIGEGLADTNFDGTYSPSDVSTFQSVLYSQNQQFNPAADLNGDGKVDDKDLFLLRQTLTAAGASGATLQAARNAVLQRGDLNHDGVTNAADIDLLYKNLGSTNWLYDLNSTGVADHASVDTLVHTILNTEYGDANLDGKVDFGDFVTLSSHFGQPGGWADGDFNGDGKVDFGDFVLLSEHFGSGSLTPGQAMDVHVWDEQHSVPEPSAILLIGLCISGAALRRKRASFH